MYHTLICLHGVYCLNIHNSRNKRTRIKLQYVRQTLRLYWKSSIMYTHTQFYSLKYGYFSVSYFEYTSLRKNTLYIKQLRKFNNYLEM